MYYLWRVSDDFKSQMYGKYIKEQGPDRFIFSTGLPISHELPIPEFYFDVSSDELESWDLIGNDAGLPLAGPRLIQLLSAQANEDVQFISSKIITNDGRLNGWMLVNVVNSLQLIDHSKSDYWFISGTQRIGGFRKLCFSEESIGKHQLVRDREYLAHIVVSEDLKASIEMAGICGLKLVSPDDYMT